MALQSMTNINVDFYDKKYILINAKQFDKKSRFISIACYNHGELYSLNEGEHSAYIRYKKADNHSVFNFCKIDRNGKIIVELTEQMLATDGICCADLVIVNEGGAKVDTQTGEIIGIENTSILSTMPIHIDVTGTSVENSDIESSYEFNGLNTALEKAEAEYTEVILTSKSWAVGDTGIRNGENTDNAKYYAKQSSNSASAAKTSELNAANSKTLAEEHMQNSLLYSQDSKTYMNNAKSYMDNAKLSETNAKTSENNAKTSEDNSKLSENSAKTSELNALSYKDTVESINNSIASSINTLASHGNIGSFIFMGEITFEELILLSDDKKANGYVYKVTNDFNTDDSFIIGSGFTYAAGTNIYYVINEEGSGKWNCLGGVTTPTATVNEVKDYLGI